MRGCEDSSRRRHGGDSKEKCGRCRHKCGRHISSFMNDINNYSASIEESTKTHGQGAIQNR